MSVAIEAHRTRQGSEDPLKKEREGVQLIMAGTENGLLCVLDKDNGEIQCTVKVRERLIYIYTLCTYSSNVHVQ